MEVKFVYTVSDRGDMIRDVLRSIKSLRRFADREEIVVFYTPPRSQSSLEELSKLAEVKLVPNVTEPFVFRKERGPGRYGEKVHLCDVDCENVVFLDADTVVRKDIRELLQGDYDFSSRIGEAYYEKDFDMKIWREMFARYGAEPIPMPNAGFMIFKNWCHRDIKDLWLKFLREPLPHPYKYYHKDQYSLALALSLTGKRIRWMTEKEHSFRWMDEPEDAYVVHGEPPRVKTNIIPVGLRRKIPLKIRKKILDLIG